MRWDYPPDCPVFRSRQLERFFVGQGPPLTIENELIGRPMNAVMCDLESGFGSGYLVGECEPLTISAVLMYEACGGTLADAEEVALSRPGRKPDKLFARAHAYQLLRTEMGLGC